MVKIINEMATDSIELGVMMMFLLTILIGGIVWSSGESLLWTCISMFFCIWLCRYIARVCVLIAQERTRNIRGTAWGG